MFKKSVRTKLAAAAFCLTVAGFTGIGAASAMQPEANLLRVGDKINIIVEGEEELSGFYTVNKGGMVNIPLVGNILVAGKTTHEAKTLITDKLKDGYLVKPEVNVKGKSHNAHPDHKKAEEKSDEMNHAHAKHDSEEQEHKCKKHKDMDHSKHGRHKKKMCPMMKAHIQSAVHNAHSVKMPSAHVKLRPGIFDEIKDVYVVGAVKRPGLYSIPPGAGHILNVIALAGGYTDEANRKNFEIVRKIDGKYYRKQAETGALDYHHGDIVIIEER